LAANNLVLPMMGERALVDMVMIDQIGDVGNFRQKLEAFRSAGYITSAKKDILYAALDAGSAASHRAHIPGSKDQVDMVIDIVDHLLQDMYVLPAKAKIPVATTPPRSPRPPKKAPPKKQP